MNEPDVRIKSTVVFPCQIFLGNRIPAIRPERLLVSSVPIAKSDPFKSPFWPILPTVSHPVSLLSSYNRSFRETFRKTFPLSFSSI